MTTFTEEQAKKQWCPLARAVVNAEHFAAGNRFEEVAPGRPSRLNGDCNCIASACMAWREASPQMEYRDVGNEDPRLPPKPPEGDGWVRQMFYDNHAGHNKWRWAREVAKRGYCGAFGKPEDA